MIFDTHAHYDDEWFDEDREALLRGLSSRGIGTVVNVGASMRGSRESVALAKEWPFVYASVGVHPDHAPAMCEADIEELRALAADEKVVAIGEIGFDYGHEDELTDEERSAQRRAQEYWFRRQLALAVELELPVIIHSRGAEGDTLVIMKEYAEAFGENGRFTVGTESLSFSGKSFPGGIIHCFSGSPETAEAYRKLGFHIGVGGVITFKNARRLPDVVASAPLEQIVLETDAPYMAPVPFRGKRNDSGYLPYVVAKIAEIKGVSEEDVIRTTTETARQLFAIREL
ncbi:MAG: TatD family hydrolase [Lachnospiraceae bacterium]|nr:TatD family hydrolase [Lachnospiraceae bacterium]